LVASQSAKINKCLIKKLKFGRCRNFAEVMRLSLIRTKRNIREKLSIALVSLRIRKIYTNGSGWGFDIIDDDSGFVEVYAPKSFAIKVGHDPDIPYDVLNLGEKYTEDRLRKLVQQMPEYN